MGDHHAGLAVYGAGAARKKDEWQSLIRQMVGDGLLRHDMQGYGGLEIAERGNALLRGEGVFESRPVAPRASPAHHQKQARAEQIGEQSEANQALITALKAAAHASRQGAPRAALRHLLRQIPHRHGPAAATQHRTNSRSSTAWARRN